MTKILLYFKIRRFYNIFGEVVGDNFITKLSDMTAENVHDVLFDINEVNDGHLNKLRAQIINFCERPRHNLIVVAIIVLTLICGYTIGRHNTIRQAELLDITENEYYINFGNEVHTYTFEGGNN